MIDDDGSDGHDSSSPFPSSFRAHHSGYSSGSSSSEPASKRVRDVFTSGGETNPTSVIDLDLDRMKGVEGSRSPTPSLRAPSFCDSSPGSDRTITPQKQHQLALQQHQHPHQTHSQGSRQPPSHALSSAPPAPHYEYHRLAHPSSSDADFYRAHLPSSSPESSDSSASSYGATYHRPQPAPSHSLAATHAAMGLQRHRSSPGPSAQPAPQASTSQLRKQSGIQAPVAALPPLRRAVTMPAIPIPNADGSYSTLR